MSLAEIKRIFIYQEPRNPAFDAAEVACHVGGMMPLVDVELLGPLLEERVDRLRPDERRRMLDQAAMAIADARIRDPMATGGRKPKEPLPGEVDFERRRLENRQSGVFGILYDGHEMARLYGSLLSRDELRLGNAHIVFTNQLIGTWEEADKRYHARTIVCGSPAIISLAGLIEAPAKEKGYYLARRSSEMLGLAEEEKMELAREFAGDSLEHDDPRLTEIAKGYAMQALAYWLTGWPFCEDEDCRLFNAHWQREMLRAQLAGGYDYCNYHREAFSR